MHCKFSSDCNSEKILKIGKYLTKLCVEHLGFTFFGIGLPCIGLDVVDAVFRHTPVLAIIKMSI